MELKYLITFKTILEAGTHQRAAEKLNYSRAAITFQMQQLEQELSIKLFEKIGRRMKVTQAGKELLPYIDSIIKNMEIIENYTKRIEKMSGELSISLPESLLTYKIQNTLKSFAKFIFWLSVVLTVIWSVIIIDSNAKLNVHYYKYNINILIRFIQPIVLFLGGTISSFLIYGLGEIIEVLKNIDRKLNSNNDNSNEQY